ncbi:hypothetical protein [Streptomyces sp. NBC_01373]|uniref:hypothetical protein n=1 Tax=Streptomyces sp. NBC_01373 TaxID=2903843 RepID=UPI00225AF6D3|nr:hypothetical protein [Streptomyces sp. NBC_01373]MCX4707178.1 hypothetical protein [Streptomyces sp. NBC_01373]
MTPSRDATGHLEGGAVVGRDMELGEAGPGVEARADEAAEAACNLADAASQPDAWSAAAVEDVVEAIDTLTAALATLDPAAAQILARVQAATAEVLALLNGAPEPGATPAGETTQERRPRRPIGLGPGWKGVDGTPPARRPARPAPAASG